MGKQFPHSYEVCSCKHVTLGEIIYAIKEEGARSVEEIENITDAGSACGCCVKAEDDFGDEDDKKELYVQEIVEKFVKKEGN
jgi:NAD(P)H-nitrite reductase large subunit